ncbi:MAG: T9SS type A sorting domain-containing protein [Parachlamydiaceae bacterium]|nr:T9SS type A sorting domain-containing protein [Parachlamydiaceae bacterium]
MKFRILIFAPAMLATTSQFVGQSFSKVNINNISTFVYIDGRMDIAPNGYSGFKLPFASEKFKYYTSGFHWGGLVNSEIRIGGAKYSSSLKSGWIDAEGNAQQQDGQIKIFRVRPDYPFAKLDVEIKDEGKSEAEIRQQYILDNSRWPINLGAPFKDVNGDNKFTDGLDIPGYPNANQTLWFVANDSHSNNNADINFPFSSKPTGLELQVTIWAYSNQSQLKNCIFKSFKLINKSKTQSINDMYIGMFCDVDIGEVVNDLVGCDTTLNLGYLYNSTDSEIALGNNLPVTGYVLLKGPTIDGSLSDYVIVKGKNVFGKKNLKMSSFNPFPKRYVCPTCDPAPANPKNYYQALRGLNMWTGVPFVDLTTDLQTRFPYSGDPRSNTGWLDEILDQNRDRQFQINSGPFNMAPGDTQEVVFAQLAYTGMKQKETVTYLKYLARIATEFYNTTYSGLPNNVIENDKLPTEFSLEQNYPNPFNPETTISYKVQAACKVSLKVYDLLGREVATLVDEYKQPGIYKVKFNVETRHGASLHSGVFFYTLTANSFTQTKKMMLIK